MEFKRRSATQSSIPTGSMADITFLLLIFFMVSTVFVRYRYPGIILPKAQKIEDLKKRKLITYLFISADQKLFINDAQVRLDQITPVIYQRMAQDSRTIVSLKCDYRASYGLINKVLEALRNANALRINFATDRKQ